MALARPRTTTHLRIGLTALLLMGLSVPASADVGRYMQDRVNDFVDIFRIRGGAPKGGKGYGAKARVTALVQVGAIHFDGHYTGIDGRAIGTVREQRTEGGVSLLYFSRHRMNKVRGNDFLRTDTTWAEIEDRRVIRNLPYWDDGRGDVTTIGLEVATPALAVDLAVSPAQFVDFVVGWVTIDLFRDDMLHVRRREPDRFIFPETDPEPDTEAPGRELRERLDAERAERERRRMEELGQLGEDEAALEPAPSREMPAPSREMPAPGETRQVPAPGNMEDIPLDSAPAPVPTENELPEPVEAHETMENDAVENEAEEESASAPESAIDEQQPLSGEALDQVDERGRSLIYSPGNSN